MKEIVINCNAYQHDEKLDEFVLKQENMFTPIFMNDATIKILPTDSDMYDHAQTINSSDSFCKQVSLLPNRVYEVYNEELGTFYIKLLS